MDPKEPFTYFLDEDVFISARLAADRLPYNHEGGSEARDHHAGRPHFAGATLLATDPF